MERKEEKKLAEHVWLATKAVQIRQRDTQLLRLTLSENITDADMAELLDGCDISEESLHFNLLLARLINKHPNIKFPRKHIPRVQGISKFVRFKNLSLFNAFNQVGTELNRREIPILLMKGIALKQRWPQSVRPMFDIDFAVPDERFKEAVEVAIQFGYTVICNAHHSTDLVRGDEALDIHRHLMPLESVLKIR